MSGKPIKQLDEFGCGMACVASLLDIGYKDALQLFIDGNKKVKTTGFTCKEITKALNSSNVVANYQYLKPKLKRFIYDSRTIVFIARCKRYPSGHYLLRANNKWMDPWINFQKDDNIHNAFSGYRKCLPGKPIYAIFCNKMPTLPLINKTSL